MMSVNEMKAVVRELMMDKAERKETLYTVSEKTYTEVSTNEEGNEVISPVESTTFVNNYYSYLKELDSIETYEDLVSFTIYTVLIEDVKKMAYKRIRGLQNFEVMDIVNELIVQAYEGKEVIQFNEPSYIYSSLFYRISNVVRRALRNRKKEQPTPVFEEIEKTYYYKRSNIKVDTWLDGADQTEIEEYTVKEREMLSNVKTEKSKALRTEIKNVIPFNTNVQTILADFETMLTGEEFEVMKLKHMNGYTWTEINEAMGKDVRNSYYKAQKKMQSYRKAF